MGKKVILFILLLSLITTSLVLAENKTNIKRETKIKSLESKLKKTNNNKDKVKILKNLGVLYHQEAVLGNEEAVNKAIDSLKKAQGINNSPVVKAWYGSALTLKARYSFVFGKIYYSKKGINILDEAINMVPENIEVRLLRGVNSVYLPNFIFHRLELAAKDLKFVINKSQDNSGTVNGEQLVTAHLNLGKYYEKKGRDELAIKEWQKVINLDANQTQSERARSYIGEIKNK
jgi:tetratricopeptide (TPR) repeat protein